ncbi:TPA: hypothetical protein U0K45_000872 [Streptococcus suis]|nr:hypothetical protein [Streptococcus suis]
MSFGLLNDFIQTSNEERIEVLYRYLVKGESGTYIAENYYNNKNYAWKISAITQGYCEKGGKNRGKVSATIDEIKLFVETYPEGTYEHGITISNWLQNKSNSESSSFSTKRIDTVTSKDVIMYTPQYTTQSVDEILKYIYSQGLGFSSEYKYSFVLRGDVEKIRLKKELYGSYQDSDIYFIAIFEDYLVYILGALGRGSTDILIPFKEIEQIIDKKYNEYLEIDVLYKGKTVFGNNYRVSIPFINQKSTYQQKLYDDFISQFAKWKSEGQHNFSSQLPVLRKQLGLDWSRAVASILYKFLCERQRIEEIVKSIYEEKYWSYGLTIIVKLLIFDFRLKVSDCGKLSETSCTINDFERCVTHFKYGIRVDAKEMSGGQPIQSGLYVIKSFLNER